MDKQTLIDFISKQNYEEIYNENYSTEIEENTELLNKDTLLTKLYSKKYLQYIIDKEKKNAKTTESGS